MRTKEELRHDMKLRILAWAILIVPILLCAWSVKGQARGATGDTGPAGGQTAPARGVVAQPQPVMDTASAQAIAPLAIQYQALEARRAQLGADYQAFWTKFHQAEMHALMNATTDGKPTPLDYTRYAVDPNTGTKIVPRQGVPNR